jgi:nucleotide-binding universal stress UspA family protein
MNQKQTLLVCVPPDLEPDILTRYILNSSVFANQIAADIHFLCSPENLGAVNSALKSFNSNGEQTLKTVLFRPFSDWTSPVLNETVKRYPCDLVVVPSGDLRDDNASGTQIRRRLLEQAREPTLVVPLEINLIKTPVSSILIPMSGEIRVSSALKFGLRLTNRIHVPVDLLHVTKTESPIQSPLETMGDQPQHEYRALLDGVLAEACPFSEVKERAEVRTLYEVQGIPAVEILQAVKKLPFCALVVEWHGSFSEGRGKVLKNILNEVSIPIFLVRTEVEQRSVLKIGPDKLVA